MLLEQRHKIGLPSQAMVAIAALLHAIRLRQGEDAARMAVALIGLGEGLTPAGDDFLVGFLAALRIAGASDPVHHAFFTVFSNAIAAAAFRTNVISRSYLEAATNGEVSEPLSAVIECIACGAAPEIVRARVSNVFAVGASSGKSAMLGFLLGAVAWEGRNPISETIHYIDRYVRSEIFALFAAQPHVGMR
jgi:hypothetical protein